MYLKAAERLAFKPATSLEEGMARFVAWYRSAGRAARAVP